MTVEVEKARANKYTELKNARNGAVQVGQIEYMGHTFDLDEQTYINLTTGAAFHALIGSVPPDFAWFDINNIPVPMTYSDFKGFVQVVLDHVAEVYRKYATARASVAMAQTVEEINAVAF